MNKLSFVGTFVPTQFSTAQEKAKFAAHFVRFVESGFKESLFTKAFYRQLSNCFGHIAHFDRDGFYHTWFRNPVQQLAFLTNVAEWRCYGSPEHTFSDVERVLRMWVLSNDHRNRLVRQIAEQTEREELAELERLSAKYASHA
jgi:hypothetical protein